MNAASHLVTTGLLPVNVWLVVAVAAIAPLVLWRVHSLSAGNDEQETSSNLGEAKPVEVTTPITLERVEDDQPKALPEPPKMVIPDTVRVAWKDTEGPTIEPLDLDHKMTTQVTTTVGADTPPPVVTEVIALTPSELRRRASRLNRDLVTSTKRPVTIDQLRKEFGLTRREAADLRRQVVTPTGGERS